ncbi:MAG: hypothetical protein NT068_01230 [Candidatus Nomurabacteria bacterium]|nr:hypothetical protein [Candidatus Nomurabacteria bacterium]
MENQEIKKIYKDKIASFIFLLCAWIIYYVISLYFFDSANVILYVIVGLVLSYFSLIKCVADFKKISYFKKEIGGSILKYKILNTLVILMPLLYFIFRYFFPHWIAFEPLM